jgi:hypothetical protein
MDNERELVRVIVEVVGKGKKERSVFFLFTSMEVGIDELNLEF